MQFSQEIKYQVQTFQKSKIFKFKGWNYDNLSWFKITKQSHNSTTCKIWMPVQSLWNSVMTSSEHINCHIGFISSTFLHGNCVFSDVSSKLVDNLCALHRVSLMSSVKSRQLSVGRWRPTTAFIWRRNFTEETNFLCSYFSATVIWLKTESWLCSKRFSLTLGWIFHSSVSIQFIGGKMPEEEFTQVPVKFIEDLSQKIEQLQHSLRRKQRILNKVRFFHEQLNMLLSKTK